MKNLEKQKAMDNIKKIQSNLCVYVDTLASELSTLVKSKIINPNKLDVFDAIDMCYEFEHNDNVFGDFDKNMILLLFDKGVFTEDFAIDLTQSLRMQLFRNSLN